MDTEISVSKTDPSIIEYRGRDLDTESFPKSSQLEQHAKDITSLEECRDDFETAPGSKPLSVNKILVYIIAVDKTDKNKDLSGKSLEFFEFYSDEVRLYCKLKQKALDAFNRKIQEGQALG